MSALDDDRPNRDAALSDEHANSNTPQPHDSDPLLDKVSTLHDEGDSVQLAVGDRVVGTVRWRQMRPSRYRNGEEVDVVGIETADGSIAALWASPAMLKSKIEQFNPQAGDRLAVQRFDDHPTKGYKRFEVALERRRELARD